jgi:DNA-binding transcriptional regulator YiaG
METENKKCRDCDGPMAFRGYEHVEQVGTEKVKDATGFAWQCTACGDVELTTAQVAAYEQRAAACVLAEAKHVSGVTLRYARKAIGLKQTELGLLLGHDAGWVSRAENAATDLPRAEVLAVLGLLQEEIASPGVVRSKLEALQDTNRPSLHTFEVRPARVG